MNHYLVLLPQDFIYLLILVNCQSFFAGAPAWDVVDLFCGVARISKLASKAGYDVASVDISLMQPANKISKHSKKKQRPPMDITSNAGFSFLAIYAEFRNISNDWYV